MILIDSLNEKLLTRSLQLPTKNLSLLWCKIKSKMSEIKLNTIPEGQ